MPLDLFYAAACCCEYLRELTIHLELDGIISGLIMHAKEV